MSAVEARRIARQKKILSNQESRLNRSFNFCFNTFIGLVVKYLPFFCRILDKAQTVEGNATLESYFEHQEFSTPTPVQIQEKPLEPPLFSEIKTVPLTTSQPIKEEKLASEVTKEVKWRNKDDKTYIQRKTTVFCGFKKVFV